MVSAAVLLALTFQGFSQPRDPKQRAVVAHDWVARLGREMADSIWPGFRPDTIPVLYLIRSRGTLLLGWRGALPPGFQPDSAAPGAGWDSAVDQSAANTAAELLGRGAAQVVMDTESVAALVGLTAHEAFHVFQRASRRPDRRFGQGENSFLVTNYPVFDPENEAGMALEGQILAAALDAESNARLRRFVHQFLAVRESRQRTLGSELANFEQFAELNEGLAEYALLRSVELAGRQPGFPDYAGAREVQLHKYGGLHELTEDVTLSIRLRYYATGPALGELLDRIEGPAWKSLLVNQNLTVQDALADATGYRAAEASLRRAAESTFVMAKLKQNAVAGVARLRTYRRAQVDSVLAAPGIQLVVSLEGGSIGLCGIDPQNLLQVDAGVLLHKRWLQACSGNALQATFNTPVVHDRSAQTLRAVIGADSAVKLTVGGQPVAVTAPNLIGASDLRLETPVVSLRAAKADISRDGRVLTIKVHKES